MSTAASIHVRKLTKIRQQKRLVVPPRARQFTQAILDIMYKFEGACVVLWSKTSAQTGSGFTALKVLCCALCLSIYLPCRLWAPSPYTITALHSVEMYFQLSLTEWTNALQLTQLYVWYVHQDCGLRTLLPNFLPSDPLVQPSSPTNVFGFFVFTVEGK